MISIFINFLQNYALITMIDVEWPLSFTWLTDWMYFFTFFWVDFSFDAGEGEGCSPGDKGGGVAS